MSFDGCIGGEILGETKGGSESVDYLSVTGGNW